MLVSLAFDIRDPLERLQAIEEVEQLRRRWPRAKAVIPTDFPPFGAPWLMTAWHPVRPSKVPDCCRRSPT